MKLEKTVENLKERAATTPGAIAIAAIVGIGAFLVRRKFMRSKSIPAAIEAATLAASAFGAARKAAPAK